MAFFKFRQRGQAQPEPRGRGDEPAPLGPQETIDGMRRRARHRLLGAAVLVLVAVIGFPILFDNQPRPVAVNAPITIPDKDRMPPLHVPPARGAAVPAAASLGDREEMVAAGPAAPRASAARVAPAAPAVAPTRRASAPVAPPPAREAATDDTRAADEAARARREEAAAAKARQDEERARREQETRARREADERAKRAAEDRARRDEAARARALLEGRGDTAPAAAPAKPATDGSRFIVQVGAFADDTAVREARQKAERAGVKTYTQVVDTKDGKRTRVRVGPYASRAEAEKAVADLKKAGLGGSILAL